MLVSSYVAHLHLLSSVSVCVCVHRCLLSGSYNDDIVRVVFPFFFTIFVCAFYIAADHVTQRPCDISHWSRLVLVWEAAVGAGLAHQSAYVVSRVGRQPSRALCLRQLVTNCPLRSCARVALHRAIHYCSQPTVT